MSPDAIIAVLGVGGLSAIIGAVVTGLFSKRKLGAEAADIITKAAAGVVTSLQTEVDRQERLRIEQAAAHEQAMDRLMRSHDFEMEEVRRVLQLHVAWDAIAIAKMSEIGVELPPAPPLLPRPRMDRVD